MTAAADAWYDALADRAELTRRQLLVWAGDRVAGGAPVFVEAARWHLDGALDAGRLARAFAVTAARADALRTTVVEIDGRPASRSSSGSAPVLEIVDLAGHAAPRRALDDLAQESIAACAVGKALVVPVLARLAWGRHVLVLAQHQLVSDSWSFALLHRRLEEAYERPVPDADTTTGWPQFAEYVAFERAYRRSPAVGEARRHWERVRAGGRPAGAPAAGERERTRVRRIVVPLGTPRSAAVRRAAAERGSADVGLFVFFAAVVAAHLHRTLGTDDVVLDAPFANRPSARFKETLGTFMNVCPVRVEVSPRDRFRDLRTRLAAATWEAARHQTFTGHGGGVPHAYEVLVNVHRPAVAAARFGACAMRVEWLPPTHRFGAAAVAVHDFGATGELTLVVDLNEAVFSAGSRAAFAASLLRLVDEQLVDGDRRLAGAERAGAATAPPAGGGAASAAREATLWSGFVARAEAAPEAVAVRSGDATVTYGELLRQATDAASRLSAAGAGRDTVVGVWGARGPRWLRALLGVLAAGAVYLPLDPSWPLRRVGEVLRRSGARLFVADGAPPDLASRVASPGDAWRVIAIDGPVVDASSAAPPPGPHAGDVAYAFYTSGSTGAPKGALVEHAGLRNHLDAKVALLGLGPGDRVAQSATAGFDVSLWQCLAPLLAGAEVDILPDDVARAPATLARVATERRVTILEVVPTVLRVVLDAEEDGADGDGAGGAPLAALRFLVVTGEALPPELCRRWFARRPTVPLVNAYGPTECADDVTHHVLRAAPPPDVVVVPIGRPIPGMTVYVLDAALRPAPDGEPGELCVAGVGVARGYLGDPERSAAAFVTRPLGPVGDDVRVYRTGDRGRRLPDGTFVWLGRLDAQVKIRGMRVEPAEVEATLGEHPDVRQAVVVAHGSAAADPRLVAYVVLARADARGAEAPSGGDLERARVREWERLWDDTYARESPAASDAAFDTAGWRSRYTRRPIPAAEMREWLDGAVGRVRALAPRIVLEIGCGSGMMLARLAPTCARWLAVDCSAAAVDGVRRRHLADGRLPHVAVERAAAHALALPPGFHPDLVLLNSVAQYFPSLAYLRAVLVNAWAMLDEAGAIFVGDVRSLPLARTLHTSVELARAPGRCAVGEVRARIEHGLAREHELLIDPAFFAALARTHGGTVDVELKRGRVHNELTRFRYDVTWRRGGDAAGPEDAVVRFAAYPTLAEVRGRLVETPAAALVLHDVPNPRLQREVLAVELLAAARDAARVEDVRDEIAARPLAPGLDPEDLWTSPLGADRDLVIGWSRAGLDRYDARLRPRRCGARGGGADRAARGRGFPGAPLSGSVEAAAHANDPGGTATIGARLEALRAFVRARLPEASVPATFVAVPEVPRTPNGKVDHAALAAHGEAGIPVPCDALPASSLERAVAAIWGRFLGVSEVGRDDDFFALGGDSLLVYRVLRALRAEVGVELDPERFLARPTVAGAAAAIAAAAFAGLDAAEADALLAEVEAHPDGGAAAPHNGDGPAREDVDA
ncbi:MAG: amino acid adenylation domain-containing protein [Deltaproteobacteria bacterium]|nr:amino acid adenylation domain-containing protein [Deltaproteobacteria bacterium]